ncbi:MAG TPA: Fur family transcriptional regulator [Candidatus Methylomirabilis sp.]|nr:Fur family transcriptional regulator [Candidatus Methylomirabilis sp.]
MHFANNLQNLYRGDAIEQYKAVLGGEGHSWTRARSAVLAVLTSVPRPLRAEEIHRALHDGRINLSSVYRALRLFRSLKVVRRVELGEGAARYELADEYRDHHHHLVCDGCGRIEDVTACPIEAAGLTRRIRRRTGFTIRSHVLELFGVCRTCRRGGR